MNLATLLQEELERSGTASVRQLVTSVRASGGRGISRAAIERQLRGDARFVADGDPGKALWTLQASAAEDTDAADHADEEPEPDPEGPIPDRPHPDRPHPEGPSAGATVPDRAATRAEVDGMRLREWQAAALAAWSTSCRGVVEAVTGTGKTRLAMAAIRSVIDAGGRALVLVPTLELQEQWARELRALLPGITVGRLGGGHDDDLFAKQVVVSTPHSAAAVPVDLPPGAIGLLVADEAHRYGAPTWGAALSQEFAMRLALTATYERGDEGVAEVLEPYFGEVVYRYRYDRAVADGTIAPFRIALAGVRLSDRENEAHTAADVRARQLHRELVHGLGMPREPRALFAAVAAVVAEGDGAGRNGKQVRACREYLVRVRERREVAASAAGKLVVCRSAAPALLEKRTLVFTDTIEQADAAVTALRSGGLHAETVHGGLPDDKRRIRLAQFRNGSIPALVAPRVLDEGVDVPDADVALVLAAFRTRRHLIQRLGRVLRLKPDGRQAQLVLAHALGTAEDPERGGHAGFLDEVRGVATSIDHLDVDGDPEALTRWLGASDDGSLPTDVRSAAP
jgi:superfamily II DNA or RNA helicase